MGLASPEEPTQTDEKGIAGLKQPPLKKNQCATPFCHLFRCSVCFEKTGEEYLNVSVLGRRLLQLFIMSDAKMEVDETGIKKRFEVCSSLLSFKPPFQVKKWNAVALWWGSSSFDFIIIIVFRSWDIVVDTCAICRNHIMDLCIECQANQVLLKSN